MLSEKRIFKSFEIGDLWLATHLVKSSEPTMDSGWKISKGTKLKADCHGGAIVPWERTK